MLLGNLLIHGLHHHAHDRLGAARTQQDATVLTERRFCGGHGIGDSLVAISRMLVLRAR